MKHVVVAAFLALLLACAWHAENGTIAAKQRHVIYDEMWWFVG